MENNKLVEESQYMLMRTFDDGPTQGSNYPSTVDDDILGDRDLDVQAQSSAATSAPSKPMRTYAFEAMPKPGFSSGWPVSNHQNLLKRKGDHQTKQSKSGAFPIQLDKKGHPLAPIQLGPKRLRRVDLG